MNVALAALLLLLACGTARAEDPYAKYDRVTLKDQGTLVVGRIQTMDDEAVVILTPNGRTLRFALKDVDKIEPAPQPEVPKIDPQELEPEKTGGTAEDGTKIGLDHGLSIKAGGELEAAERKRKLWAQHGGELVGYALSGQLLVMHMSISTGGQCGNISVSGVGATASGRVSYIHFVPPDVEKGGTTFFMIRAGGGADFGGLNSSTGSITCSGETIPGSSQFQGQLVIPAFVGAQMGLGGYRDNGVWKGYVLGLAYQPAVTIPIGGVKGGPGTQFNFIGLNLSLDLTTLEAVIDRAAQKAHWTFSLFLLPPVGDLPLLLQIGGGATWY